MIFMPSSLNEDSQIGYNLWYLKKLTSKCRPQIRGLVLFFNYFITTFIIRQVNLDIQKKYFEDYQVDAHCSVGQNTAYYGFI